MWKYYNPNPKGNHVGDCTVRAICKALNSDWYSVYAGLSGFGYALCDMPSANHVWGAYLKSKGFERHLIDDHGDTHYTVDDFCRDNPVGTYILAIQEHVVCVRDGCFYDSWDSGSAVPLYYWSLNRI